MKNEIWNLLLDPMNKLGRHISSLDILIGDRNALKLVDLLITKLSKHFPSNIFFEIGIRLF